MSANPPADSTRTFMAWVDYLPSSPNRLNSGKIVGNHLREKHVANAAWLSALLVSDIASWMTITSSLHANTSETPSPDPLKSTMETSATSGNTPSKKPMEAKESL